MGVKEEEAVSKSLFVLMNEVKRSLTGTPDGDGLRFARDDVLAGLLRQPLYYFPGNIILLMVSPAVLTVYHVL